MGFTPVPTESRNQINKAGAILIQEHPSPDEYSWARDLAEKWRASHAYPINTFQATLRRKLRSFRKNPIAAQRLKRMPTIIDKLRRYPAMKLATMQDIGGVRAILDSVDEVYDLADGYLKSSRFTHELQKHKDYIRAPRDEDGYRGVHLVYKYENRRAPQYSGLRIELQIRTRLQHLWATAVESMGTLLGQALKSRQGDQEWLDFFAVTASAFALREGTPPVPRFADLSKAGVAGEVAEAERGLQALNVMSGLSVAADAIYSERLTPQASAFHLIVLNSLERRVDIYSYDRRSFEQAVRKYAAVEAQAADKGQLEPVLVSAGPMGKLRRAYPNFFLDIRGFASVVRQIVRGGRPRSA